MFTAYFDASGSPDSEVAVVVAGFVAKAEQWIEFERNWNECLSSFQVSGMHMKDFAHSRGEFREWKGDEKRRQQFLAGLINVIKLRVLHSFSTIVVMEDYRKVDSVYRLTEFSKPYALAGCTTVAKAKRWAQKHGDPDDTIMFVFEDGDKDKGDLMRCMDAHNQVSPIFLRKQESIAFQAADLLAYEHLLASRKMYEQQIGTKVDFEDLRYPLRALSTIPGGLDGGEENCDWGFHDESDLLASCKGDGMPLR
jgi:hypothetical protein